MSIRLPRTMTVGELLDELSDADRSLPVFFVSDYGDICHTQQLHRISEAGTLYGDEPEGIVESAYSESGLALEELTDEEREDRETQGDEDTDIFVIR